MPRLELVALNTALRNAIDDIEDLVGKVESPAQSTMNMGELNEENDDLAEALREVVAAATTALDELDDDDDGNDAD